MLIHTDVHWVFLTAGAIIGFANLGDVNNQYEKYIENGAEEKEEVAKSMLVLMVRGLFTKLQFA